VKLAFVILLAIAGIAHAQPAQPGGWEIKVPEKLEVALGAIASMPITIAVDRGLSISKSGPVLIDLAPDAGLYIKKRRIGRPDAVDPDADVPRFVVPIRADAAGELVVKVRIRLWLCGGKVCRPLDLKRQTTILVTAPQPPVSGTP
jgi:hypothetical protein